MRRYHNLTFFALCGSRGPSADRRARIEVVPNVRTGSLHGYFLDATPVVSLFAFSFMSLPYAWLVMGMEVA